MRTLPFYLVVDVSASMTGMPIHRINSEIRILHRSIVEGPVAQGTVHMALIGFSNDARVVLPLSDLRQTETIPAFKTGGATYYAPAFDLLFTTIETDMAHLRAEGHRILRPAVFFISDGLPIDDPIWRDSHQRLVDPAWPYRPRIIAFGLAGANDNILKSVGTAGAFMADESMGQTDHLKQLWHTLTTSFKASVPSGDPVLMVPRHIPGFIPVAGDPIVD